MRATTALAAARVLVAVALGLVLFAVAPGAAWAAGDWPWPVDGELLTEYRNGADPYAAGQHRGIDIGAPEGDDVRAAAGGVVTFAGTVGSSGAVVAVRTADGRFDTSYLHLGSIDVSDGDEVAAGERLGSVGTSGARSTPAPHLHFGVRAAGEEHAYRDPLRFLTPRGGPAPEPPAPVVAPVRVGPVPDAVRPRVPLPRPAPAPSPRPLAPPERAPAPGRALGPKGAFEPLPVAPAARRPGEAPVPARPPGSSPATVRAPQPADVPAPEHSSPRGLAFELGPVLACVGIVLAVAMACRPSARRRSPAINRRTAPERRRAPGSIERRWASTSPRRSTT